MDLVEFWKCTVCPFVFWKSTSTRNSQEPGGSLCRIPVPWDQKRLSVASQQVQRLCSHTCPDRAPDINTSLHTFKKTGTLPFLLMIFGISHSNIKVLFLKIYYTHNNWNRLMNWWGLRLACVLPKMTTGTKRSSFSFPKYFQDVVRVNKPTKIRHEFRRQVQPCRMTDSDVTF